MKTYQVYNAKIKRWIKLKKLESGRTQIMSQSKKPFVGVIKK